MGHGQLLRFSIEFLRYSILMSSAAKPKVIVVGCGVVGPVLALLLKHQGYDPVIYERGSRERNAGLSLLLQLNGLRVLSLIPGLVEQLPGMAVEQTVLYSVVPSDERVLGTSDYPAALRREYGLHGAFGVQRGRFLALLADMASKSGMDVHYERGVVGVEHGDAFVRVRLSDGGEDTAGLVVGCDGLHSNVRVALFGKEDAAFTGLTQTGGISPSGAFADKKPTIYNFFGDGIHLIAYPISQQTYSWAITRRETETKETWRAMDEHAQDEVRSGLLSRLPFGAGDLVRNAEKITKYGLYDRPELTSWHKGRVVLVGDAAHPTSPHLGQGANQAFEDAYHLVRLLCEHHHPADEEGLSAVFTEFEAKRIARTSALVRGARKAGEARVVEGEDQARARNDVLLKEWEDEEAVLRRIKDVLGAEEEWIDLPER